MPESTFVVVAEIDPVPVLMLMGPPAAFKPPVNPVMLPLPV